jgi:hypothetical protein
MIDVDFAEDDEKKIRQELSEKGIDIFYEYPTKNGIHLILKPFNPTNVNVKIEKNSMMLWAYGKSRSEWNTPTNKELEQ